VQARWIAEASAPAASAAALAASAVVVGGPGSDVELSAHDLPIGALRGYLSPYFSPRSDGAVTLRARAHWDGLPEAAPSALDVDELRVDGLQVRDASTPDTYAAWREALVQGVHADFRTHRASVTRIQLTKPDVGMRRGTDGTLEASRWVRSSSDPASVTTAAAGGPQSTSEPPSSGWQVDVAHAAISGGRVRWRDAPAAGNTVAADLEAVDVSIDNASWPAARGASSTLKVAARILPAGARTGAGSGQLSFAGQLGLEPVAWRGQLRVERLPLHLADPYVGEASPLFIDHADFGWRGAVDGGVTPAGLRLHVRGDALLTDVRTCARGMVAELATGAACDLLAWQSLAAKDTEVTLAPGHAPVVTVADASLDKAYARLVVTEQGHFNLTDLAPPAGAASAPAEAGPGTERSPGASEAAVTAAASAPSAPNPSRPSKASNASAATTPATAASAAPASPAADTGPDIRVANLHWTDARVDYTDRLVRPNYSADLSGLTGRLGGFSSRSTDLAPLELTGRVAGTGVLDVQGRLNPLAKPLALDVTAKATDIELAPLSPYAGKYAGYAIDRGKLSMNVHYRVQPDGRLDATNQVILNQLTFGERVESPSATKLPVLLAVALLKDRHGVIDVNLPIGGSINDPQFSVGGIVVKLILNLLGKALTAPFALLSGGGQDDLSQVLFVPGTARMREGSDPALDKVANALNDRPALQLTITGLADDDQEHADMQGANLDARLSGLRRTELLQQGEANPAEAPALSAEDRARLVKRLYADTKLPDKPRNIVGLAKDLPEAEMEARLKAGLPLPPEAARQLAIQRARAVRDALVARGLPDERMFVAAPKMHGAGSAEPEAWLPHAQLELSTK
jgi:outer membrane protein OmpA-like peptidoglycan-associated protein